MPTQQQPLPLSSSPGSCHRHAPPFGRRGGSAHRPGAASHAKQLGGARAVLLAAVPPPPRGQHVLGREAAPKPVVKWREGLGAWPCSLQCAPGRAADPLSSHMW